MRKIYNSIVEAIGDTPMVKLNKLSKGIKGTLLAKVEYFNPGNSVKDRMAVKMVEDAEKDGRLKPGGTIIEGTSGNTGMGLALVAIQKGYKCVFVTTSKQSAEKVNILKALGAEVMVCPTDVAPEDPRSYYSVSSRLVNEIPNSWKPNQYDNISNSIAHYESTGPEIWEQTEGKITHLVAGVGTGGTISGTAKYLKEKNKNIKIIGVDTYGSIFKKLKETGIFDKNEIYPYMTEGIGEDILPQNVDMNVIDQFIKVTDKDAAVMTRSLAREEGLFCGWSCGSAMWAALEYAKENLIEKDVMVIILPDHGSRYVNKIYNDQWMKDHGFLEAREFATARDIIQTKNRTDVLISVNKMDTVAYAIRKLNDLSISQLPVMDAGEMVGSIIDSNILSKLIEDPTIKDRAVSEVMDKPFPIVGLDNTVDALSFVIKSHKALLVKDEQNVSHIITQADLLEAMGK
jgi:cystathionine beta-synthase